MKNQPTEPGNGSVPETERSVDPRIQEFLAESIAPEEEDGYLRESDAVELVEMLARRDAEREGRFAEAMGELEDLKRGARLRESAKILQLHLANSGLPRRAQTIIAEKFEGKIFAESTLEREIENQLRLCEAYASATPAAAASSQHYSHVSQGRNGLDWAKAEIDRACGFDWRKAAKSGDLQESEIDTYRNLDKMPSIRRPFEMMYGSLDAMYDGKLRPGALLLQEATSADLPQLLGDSMYRALLQQYKDQPPLWREFCEVVPVPNFKTQRRILMGGLGILPRVTESDTAVTYLTLGFPRDEERTYTVGTFGGLIIVTRQAIINDDLQGIQRFPKEAASSAVMTLNLNVFRCLMGNAGGSGINTDTSYTGLVHYHAAHNNLETAGGVSYQNLVDMLERLAEVRRFANVYTLAAQANASQADITLTAAQAAQLKVGDELVVYGGSGAYVAEQKTITAISSATVTLDSNFNVDHSNGARVEQLGPPISFEDVKFVHANQLKAEIFSLMASPLIPGLSTNDASALYPDWKAGRIKPFPLHSMYMGGSANLNNFFAAAGRPIECGFLGGREEPEMFLQDNPLVDNVFRGDQITWKIRHEHGQVLTDHRLVQAGIF